MSELPSLTSRGLQTLLSSSSSLSPSPSSPLVRSDSSSGPEACARGEGKSGVVLRRTLAEGTEVEMEMGPALEEEGGIVMAWEGVARDALPP